MGFEGFSVLERATQVVFTGSAILLAVDTQIVDDRRLLVVQLERRIEGTRDYKVEEVAETIEFIVRAVLEK
jgi:hypothetical protein